MKALLMTDGSSDRMLVYPLNWLFQQHGCKIELTWANPYVLGKASGLAERVQKAHNQYAFELLIVHRDAEAQAPNLREDEILSGAGASGLPLLPVIPVRMSEAWFLFDETSVRRAAGNPNGREHLSLPPWSKVEGLPDPKAVLYESLRQASGLRGRRLAEFHVEAACHRLAELLLTYEPLRELSAFRAVEGRLRELLTTGF